MISVSSVTLRSPVSARFSDLVNLRVVSKFFVIDLCPQVPTVNEVPTVND